MLTQEQRLQQQKYSRRGLDLKQKGFNTLLKCSAVWCGVVCMEWYGMVWCDVVWFVCLCGMVG